MKADGSLKSLLQGVSQQPTRDRLPGQSTEQINMSADPVKGLTRRPGDDLVGQLGSLAEARGWAQLLTQDGRQFIMKITPTGPKIFDYNANEYTVNLSGDMTYWSAAGKWSVGTIKQTTYIANEGVLTKMLSTTREYINLGGVDSEPKGIIQILGGNYGKRYAVIINGIVAAAYTTHDGSLAAHSSFIGTRTIAGVLRTLLETPAGGTLPPGFEGYGQAGSMQWNGMISDTAHWTITNVEDLLMITNLDGTVFTLSISDDASNVNAKAMTDSVPDIADLPRFAPHDYAVRVAAETDPEQDLWLRFVSSDPDALPGDGFGDTGAWYETVAPGITTSFDKTTMPRSLEWNPTTLQFTCAEGDWEDRTLGTNTTNPVPSFIGYGISDISTFQNRLVFLAGPNLIASRTRRYTNFWVGSASTLVDTDPLDMSSQAAFATAFEFAIPHNKDLVIFSSKGQFVLFGRSAITPKNASIVLTTSFEADLSARPSACGRNVFFATRYGRFTGIREFFTEGGTDINDTRPITQHVKSYIKGGATHISSTSNYDTMLVHTDTERNKVYPYQFIWNDNEKVQSAWSTWTFPDEVIHSFFDDELIYFVEEVDGMHYLLRMSLDVLPEGEIGYHVHTSNRFDVAGVNTQFVLPYDWLHTHTLIVVQGDDAPHPGLPVRINSVVYDAIENGYVVTLSNDMQGGNVVVGVNYRSEYQPTMPRVKDESGVVISNARLMINQFLISLEKTGHIIGQKLTKWGNGPEVPFEGYLVNSPSSIVGQPALDDFVYKLPFKEKAENAEIRLFTEEHWPMTFLDVEWEGTVNKRGKRISTGE